MSAPTSEISIPADLLPGDGRFGCGPSKVRPEAVEALAASARDYLGTSHRQASVRFMVAALRNGVSELLELPDGYEVVLGNGGTTAFWDAATFGLIERRSQHLSFGEFSSKFAAAATSAPHIEAPDVIESPYGTHPEAKASPDVDAYCLTHNETSTGVAMQLTRPEGAEGLVLVDATSAAGGLRFDASQVDAYYFAPQKCLASDGGLWIAALSPAAVDRIERIAASDRWAPGFLDLKIALDNSRKDQTYNTPALATIHLAVSQVQWIIDNGGMPFAASRTDQSAEAIYDWAEASEYARPYVTDPAKRSHVVATVDLDDDLPAATVSGILRANGIVDTEGYRKLGRNQLRVALFPAIDPTDVAALTRCVDYVATRLRD
ncbi:MAG TPA: phosphoserine transaminase [Acidimicrobiales bacterium]|nr:phosphoserine transaminase [Acidimicrobiales bacterium]